MTATDGGPALDDADAVAAAGGRREPRVTARPRALPLRTVLGLAQVEAWQLGRSALVLTGLLAGGCALWVFAHSAEPLWWDYAWQIGYGQLLLGMAVLVAAQLAAGRARRNGMADLYASFPATAAKRTLAHLCGLVGAVPTSLVLIGAAVAAAQATSPVGSPSIVVLAGGLLLVLAAGAIGVAIGVRFPHPLAGILVALALLVADATSHLATGGAIWLLPWEIRLDDLSQLPGPLAGYPPGGAHVLELAGIAAAAGIVALAVTTGNGRARARLAATGILAVTVVCAAGVVQLRPIPTAALSSLVAEAGTPASAQRCTTASQVRYCLYTEFGSQLPSLEAPVNQVLARLPARPDQPLTVRQVISLGLLDSTLTHGHPGRQVSQWIARVQRGPVFGNGAPASAIYLPVGFWPAAGGPLAAARFDLALATAQWAVGIPPQAIGKPSGQVFLPCVPFDQAREAIAIWLAVLATHPPAGELRAGLGRSVGSFSADVRNRSVPTWNYPGLPSGYVLPPGGGPQNTAAGYLLASVMTNLPEQQVEHVLTGAWGRWLNWRTTDAQLAHALGVRMPSVPTSAVSAQTVKISAEKGLPQSPLCTS